MASRSWVDVDLDAVAANVATLAACAPEAKLCAVVKANGYGHGAIPIASAAVEAGAQILAVAQVDEGLALRDAGLNVPIWVLSEPDPAEFPAAAAAGLEPALYSPDGIDVAASTSTPRSPLRVHLKVDTGMHRVGVRADDAVALARRIVAAPGLTLGSVWTHLACADADGEGPADKDDTVTARQLDRYEAVLGALGDAGIEVPLRHAANSAATIAHPRSHWDVVRCGISLYGLAPSPGLVDRVPLRPALAWRSRVSFVKRLGPGDGVSYGQRGVVSQPSTIATVPVGYADGYRRGLWNRRGAVLINGRRCPIVGVVTMDQTIVDCGRPDHGAHEGVAVGDEVVLIGRQGAEQITADELAASLDTINYEIPCAIGNRVERRYHQQR